jgi:hypothetical protein
MLIFVPEGKELQSTAGGYRFFGPQIIDPKDGFKVEKFYADGTELIYVNSPKLPNPATKSSPPVPDNPQDGQSSEGTDRERVRSYTLVRESDGPVLGASVLCGELGDAEDPGDRCGEGA